MDINLNTAPFGTLQVILKIAERCNLACPYCYYFYGGDESYKGRPPIISSDVYEQLGRFLFEGCDDFGIHRVHLVFHGGEPMLQKPSHFDEMCKHLREILDPVTNLRLIIQTNGTLITNNWLDILIKHNVYLSISMDGNKVVHDTFRVDHKGQGSYDKIVEGLNLCKRRSEKGEMRYPSVLSVLNANYNYKGIYNHFVNELGFNDLNFLLPDCNRDTGIPNGHSAEDYGEVLCDIFDAWLQSPNVRVREIGDLLSRLQVALGVPAESDEYQHFERVRKNQIIVIQSDGTISIDDTFIPASEWRNKLPRVSIWKVRLRQYLAMPVFDEIRDIYRKTPDKCQSCCWQAICNGGDIENRYSQSEQFDQESVYCDGLKVFFSHVARYLVSQGYPKKVLEDRLTASSEDRAYVFLR